MRMTVDTSELDALAQKMGLMQAEIGAILANQMRIAANELATVAVAEIKAVTPQRSGALGESTVAQIEVGPTEAIVDIVQPAQNRGVAYGYIVRHGPPARDAVRAARERARYGGKNSAARPNLYSAGAMPRIRSAMAILAARAGRGALEQLLAGSRP